MPVGIGTELAGARRGETPARVAGPSGFHPLALWIAVASPVAATLLLIVRLAA